MKRLSVKQLAKLSGVTVRTLHHYDAIGLLAPAYIGENNYRYYERKQMLRLQQILFYRDMGLSLSKIREIINDPDFDQVSALKSHRKIIEKELSRYHQLIQTIEKTIKEITEKKMDNQANPFQGFSPAKQAEYERQLVENYGEQAKEKIAQSKNNVAKISDKKMQEIKDEGHEINLALVECIKKGNKPNSDEVQKLIARQHAWVANFWTPNKLAYIGLGQSYCDNQDFRDFYNGYDERLVEFLSKGMKIYAEQNLK